MPSAVDSIFRSASRRSAAELDDLSAGAGLSLFGALWVGKGSASQLNIRGGSGRLSDCALRWLGDRLWLDTPAESVQAEEGYAVVTVRRSGVRQRVTAGHVIVALPAPLVREVVMGLPGDVDRSLASVTYGPFVSMGFLTREQSAMPWTRLYAVTTPGLVVRHAVQPRQPAETSRDGQRRWQFHVLRRRATRRGATRRARRPNPRSVPCRPISRLPATARPCRGSRRAEVAHRQLARDATQQASRRCGGIPGDRVPPYTSLAITLHRWEDRWMRLHARGSMRRRRCRTTSPPQAGPRTSVR